MTANADLAQAVAQVEHSLAQLRQALRSHDGPAIENQSRALQRAMSAALERSAGLRTHDAPAMPLRLRLANAAGELAAQHEALARASAALDRASAVLLHAASPAVAYTAGGRADRTRRSSVLQA